MARCRASFAHSGDRCPCVLSVADVALSPQEVDLRRWDDRHTRFLSDGKKRPHAAGFVNQANLPPASIRSPTADGQQKDLQSESARPAHVALREGKGHNVTLSD